jgi:hypothetical protein
MEVSGELHAPAGLPPGKRPRYALVKRLDGPQRRSGRCGEEKNLLLLPGIEPQFICRPDCSIDALPTELSRLQQDIYRCGRLGCDAV